MANACDAVWDATGQRIATAHTDGSICRWNSDTLDLQSITQLFNDGNWVRFDPSGETTASDPSAVDSKLVVIAEDDLGGIHLLKPSEFRERQRP